MRPRGLRIGHDPPGHCRSGVDPGALAAFPGGVPPSELMAWAQPRLKMSQVLVRWCRTQARGAAWPASTIASSAP